MKRFLLLSACLLVLASAHAQLYFQNNTSEPVTVAIAQQSNGGGFKGWFTKGWYRVAPNEKVAVASATGLNDYVYYFAFTDGGKVYDGDTNFLVQYDAPFEIRNANMAYAAKEGNYVWRSFRKLKMPVIRLSYTIQLNY